MDNAEITIGSHVLIGPNVSLYTVNHAIDPEERAQGICVAKPIHIEDKVRFGIAPRFVSIKAISIMAKARNSAPPKSGTAPLARLLSTLRSFAKMKPLIFKRILEDQGFLLLTPTNLDRLKPVKRV